MLTYYIYICVCVCIDQTFTMSSLIDRILSRSIKLINALWYSIDLMILSWSIGLVLIKINRALDRILIVSSLVDRTLSRSIRLINALRSIELFIDHILSWSMRLLHYDRSDVWLNIHYVKFGRSNTITIDHPIHLGRLIGSIDYLIDCDMSVWSIDYPMYHSRSIGSIDHPIDHDRSFDRLR
jgi:hypothetical protein